MNELRPFIYIAIFISGMVVNAIAMRLAYRFGFKASIEARINEDEVPGNKRLFADKDDKEEFDWAEEDRKDDDDED